MAKSTNKTGTWTTAGFIPHFRWNGLFLPVCVTANGLSSLPSPVRTNGRLAFALPGGTRLYPDITHAVAIHDADPAYNNENSAAGKASPLIDPDGAGADSSPSQGDGDVGVSPSIRSW